MEAKGSGWCLKDTFGLSNNVVVKNLVSVMKLRRLFRLGFKKIALYDDYTPHLGFY